MELCFKSNPIRQPGERVVLTLELQPAMVAPRETPKHGDEKNRDRGEQEEIFLQIPRQQNSETVLRRIWIDIAIPIHGAHLEFVRTVVQVCKRSKLRRIEVAPAGAVHAPRKSQTLRRRELPFVAAGKRQP